MTTVVFHANCRDGFAAAWAIRTVYPEATFIAGNFGKPLEGFPFAGQDVIFADFSLPRAEMLQIAEKAATLRVFDHHKTAEEALRDFPASPGVKIVFDMDRSGAGIAWDELHDNAAAHLEPSAPGRPWFINYVEDRDLWRFALPQSKEVNAYLGSLQYDFDTWTGLLGTDSGAAITIGAFLERKTQAYVHEVAKNSYRKTDATGRVLQVVNAPQVDCSELMAGILERNPGVDYTVCWWRRADGRFQYGLRSRPGSDVDVSEIAKGYHGGGHKHAAGFHLPILLEEW